MELHQLRYLTSVVDHGSFTAAAETLHVSQSGVSAQVAKLERELGHRLLDRGSRSLRLTRAGQEVLPLARRVLDQVDRIADTADELAGLLRGGVVLGMVRGCTIPPFLDVVADFRREHPGVTLTLAEGDSIDLQRRVAAGELDLALVAWAGAVLPELVADVVIDEPVALVVPSGHRLARQPSVHWRDLDGETVLCLSRGTGVRAAVDGSLAAVDSPVGVDLEASSPETLLQLVGRGVGVALLTASMVAGAEGLETRVVADAATTARLGVVRRAEGTGAAGRVLHAAVVAALRDQSSAEPVSGAQQRP